MAGMTVEKVVLDYCLKLPKGMKELCEDDAITYAALTCAKDVPTAKCEFAKKAPADLQAAEAWKNLNLVLKGKAKQAYALPDMPPAAPALAAKPASKPAAPATQAPAAPKSAAPASSSNTKAPVTKTPK